MTILNEDNHPLITPQFSGTAEEITTALRCWADLIENLRFLDVRVTAYNNRSEIIAHLERELQALRAEIDNVSATMTDPASGLPIMSQPIEGNAEVTEPVPPSAGAAEPINVGSKYSVPPQRTGGLGSSIANFNASR